MMVELNVEKNTTTLPLRAMSKDVNVAYKEQLKSVIEKCSFHNQSRQQSSKIETIKEKFMSKDKNFISVK